MTATAFNEDVGVGGYFHVCVDYDFNVDEHFLVSNDEQFKNVLE